jgi:hypothetical protein
MALNRYVTGPKELELVEKALTFYTERNDRLKISMASFLRAMILLFGDELERASTGFESLLAIGKKTSSFTLQVRALAYLCLVHRKRHDQERLRRVASATLALTKEHDMPEYEGLALGNLAWLSYGEGDLAECERLARAATACWSAAGTRTAFCWTGLLPLVAALSRNSKEASASEIRTLVTTLLDDSQQRLPVDLEQRLKEVVRSDSHSFSSLVAQAIDTAVEGRFM